MRVNITVVTHNRLPLTRLCLESLLPTLPPPGPGGVSVHVVDNGSTDGTPEYLRALVARYPQVRLRALTYNMGVAVAANLGWAAQDAEYYLKLDNDMRIIHPDWLDVLLSTAARNPEVGMVGHQVCDWHKTAPVTLPGGPFIESDCSGGACVLIPRHIHQRFGFWNEDYGKYGFEDLEYGLRVSLGGYRIGYAAAPPCVEHLGYVNGAIDPVREIHKQSSLQHETSGEKLYVLNRFLFEHGIRPLHVARKYLPYADGARIRFRSNPEYARILKLHHEYVNKISYVADEQGIHLDLRALKTQ